MVRLNRNVVNGPESMLRLIGGLPAGTAVAIESAFGHGGDCSERGTQFSAQFMTAVFGRAFVVETQLAIRQRDS
jgi:hypothetical protein